MNKMKHSCILADFKSPALRHPVLRKHVRICPEFEQIM